MSQHNKNCRQNELKIRRIEATADRLTGRAGLALFVAYLHGIEIFDWFDRWFGSMRKNRKGLPIVELFKQVGVKYLATATPVLDGRSFGTNMMEAALIAISGKKRTLSHAELSEMLEKLDFEPQIQELN